MGATKCCKAEKIVIQIRKRNTIVNMKEQITTVQVKQEIPVFFAADENYLPFLAVTLVSMQEYASEENFYHVHVLGTSRGGANEKILKKMERENFKIDFHDVSKKSKEIAHLIRCRDYYTSAIYFRLFIPQLFSQYDKAVYLDCDTVLLQDVARLYTTPIGNNLVGAVVDGAVASVTAFKEYTKNALGISSDKYFNSGVLVMNLKKMREMGFCNTFSKVLASYEFIVAPDQDCLNLICKGKVYYLSKAWNTMPIEAGKRGEKPALVHYNLSMKPWHYDHVLYEEYFWDFAKRTPFLEIIEKKKENFTDEMRKRDEIQGEKLIALAQAEADSPCNYLNTVVKKKLQNGGGMYAFDEEFESDPSQDTTKKDAYRTIRTGRAF